MILWPLAALCFFWATNLAFYAHTEDTSTNERMIYYVVSMVLFFIGAGFLAIV